MKIQGWYPNEKNITEIIEKRAMDRLEMLGHRIAEKARDNLKANGSVRTGNLLRSIRVTRLKGDPKQNIRVYAGNRKKTREEGAAFYAHMVEMGTAKMSAKSFLRPALRASKGLIKSIMSWDEGVPN